MLGGTIGGGIWYVMAGSVDEVLDESLTWTAERTNLRITVTERGTLQSQKTVNGVCELGGYDNKIIFLVEEGATVQEGDVVVRFDSSEIETEIAEEKLEVAQAEGVVETKRQEVEVAKNTGESEIAAAELELTLARLDFEKYRDGDLQVEQADLSGNISLAKIDLQKAQENLQNVRELVKKGFREPDQIQIAEQEVERAKFGLNRDERKLDVLMNYDSKRKLTEFEAKAEEAERKLRRAKATADANLKKAQNELQSAQAELKLQQEDLAEEEAELKKCEIKAQQTGVVAYANEDWWSESRRIREGGTVYRRQSVFHIPDMTLMEVEVKVHESEVKRVAATQRAVIRVDAFSNEAFTGVVKSVAQLSKSDRYMGGGVKEYPTIVTMNDFGDIPLRPGMTAEVEILVDNLTDVLAVPVQAIAEHRHKHFAYVQTENGYERRDVEVGQTNNRLIVINAGIEAGDVVALDARSRAAEEFSDDEAAEDSEELQELTEADDGEGDAEDATDAGDEADNDAAVDDETADDAAVDDEMADDAAPVSDEPGGTVPPDGSD
ncbi:MAG: efflux RND transporter periplasmic adaptor subunit [Planctomycetaceae bacterium]